MKIIQKMVETIEKYGLEVMKNYPDDILVYDRSFFEGLAGCEGVFAWCVGDLHSHIVPIGIHPEKNGLVSCLTNIGNRDKFFKIRLKRNGDADIKELSRDEFSNLSQNQIPLKMDGDWLVKNGHRIGHIKASWVEDGSIRIELTEVSGISPEDSYALACWAQRIAEQKAGTLFVKTQWVKNPACYELKEAA